MITFKQFLDEKAMNARAFKKTMARQGSKAKIGFEFEMFIPHDSPMYSKGEYERDYIALNRIDDLGELKEYFKISSGELRSLTWEYDDWLQKQEDGDEGWDSFIEAEYKSWYKFISANDLKPTFGWEADTGNDSARVYSEHMPDDANQETISQTFSAIAVDLTNYLGKNVTTAWKETSVHFDAGDWIIVPDNSIDADEGLFVGVEVVSPPTLLADALKDLEKMFKWMQANEAGTNNSTGLHINVSLPGIENVDLVKLVLFMGDNHVLKMFDRVNNMYTRSQTQNIINGVVGSGELPKSASEMIKLAREALSTHKYSAVHIDKLKDGYLEFRVAGNKNYETKFDQIKDVVLRFVSALEVAIDPDAERKEYLKKLANILEFSLTSQENHDLDDRPLADVLGFGDAESTGAKLSSFQAKVKKGPLTDDERATLISWIEKTLLSDLFHAFGILAVEPNMKHRAEFRLFLKRAGIEPSVFSGASADNAVSAMKKMLGLRK